MKRERMEGRVIYWEERLGDARRAARLFFTIKNEFSSQISLIKK